MIKRGISAVVAAVTLTAGLAAAPAAQAQEFKVGYVNVKAVLRDYDRTAQINEDLRGEQEKAEQVEKRLREELRDIEDQLQILVPGTARYRERKRERVFKAKEIETHREWSQYELGRQMAESTIAVYGDLQKAVKAIAKADGYQLVLKIEEGEIKGADTGLEVNLRINTRSVLHFDDTHEITEKVLKHLNDTWKASGGKVPVKKDEPKVDEPAKDGEKQ